MTLAARPLLRRSAAVVAIGMLPLLLPGCVPDGGPVYGVGYYGPAYGAWPGYYAGPSAVNYGGWRPGYQVAPYRDGGHPPPPPPRGGPPPGHAYTPAPSSHPIPSIPTTPRPAGGGGRRPPDGGGHR